MGLAREQGCRGGLGSGGEVGSGRVEGILCTIQKVDESDVLERLLCANFDRCNIRAMDDQGLGEKAKSHENRGR
jgi:hypothetical protein